MRTFLFLIVFIVTANAQSLQSAESKAASNETQNFIGTNSKTGTRNLQPETKNPLRGNGLMFTPNKGQIVDMGTHLRPDILYKGSGGGADVYLRKTGISYVYSDMGEAMHEVGEQIEELEKAAPGIQSRIQVQEKRLELLQKQNVKIHRVDMDFEGCNKNTITTNEDELEGYSNYYLPHCPKGISNVKSYNKINYKNIYNNIDVSYYGSKTTGVKYDIIVQPHADPNQVKLHWTGADKIKINSDGKLVIKTSVNEFYESIPKVYQNINGEIVNIKGDYVLNSLSKPILGEAEGEEGRGEDFITFKLGTYNPDYSLIIDPWVTYYGGSYDDNGMAITTDATGNVICSGATESLDFPVSPGANQSINLAAPGSLVNSGRCEGFIVKFNSAGVRLFATYFGGSTGANPLAVTTDLTGDVIIAGFTLSTDLPTSNPGGGAYYQPLIFAEGGNTSIFIAKFDPSGTNLLWATYYGGNNYSQAFGIATDPSNNIYITGWTFSTSFPVQAAFQPVSGGGADAFVVKFNNAGVRQWASFYGGFGADNGAAIACDANGDVYICGEAHDGFPIAGAAYQPVFQPVDFGGDGYVAKLNGNTGFPVWSTYYGGLGVAIRIDNSGNVCLDGNTSSPSNVASAGAFQPALGGSGNDGFVANFSNAGALQWGTYMGGGNAPTVQGLAVDVNNNLYAYGEWEDASSGSFPISTCAYQHDFSGNEDQVIAKYNPNGQQTCVTYIGGTQESDIDYFYGGIASFGNFLYITGVTDGGYPVTPNAFQTIYAGGDFGPGTSTGDAFITQLCVNLCEAKVLNLNFTANTTSACTNASVTFTPSVANSCDTSGYRFHWTFSGGTPTSSDSVSPTVKFSSVGTHDVKLVVTTACKTDSITNPAYITINNCGGCVLAASTVVTTNATCNGASDGNATASPSNGAGGPYTYSWSNGVSSVSTSTQMAISSLTAGIYSVTITEGSCSSISTVSITQPSTLVLVPSSQNANCGSSDGSASVSAGGGTGTFTYSWNTGSTGQTINTLSAGSYTVTVSDGNTCTKTAIAAVGNSPSPTINSLVPFSVKCNGNNNGAATVSAAGGTGTLTYSWSNGILGQTSIIGLTAGTYIISVTDASGCAAISTVAITEPSAISTPVITSNSANCNNSNGFASASALGGTGMLTYSWSNGPSGQTTGGLSPGIYTVMVSDANACVKTQSVIINSNPAPTINNITPTNVACKGEGNGSATISASGNNLTYSWSNGSSNPTSTNLSAGIYTVSVTDASACTAVSTISITEPPVITVNASQNSAATCGNANGSAVAAATGGNGNLTYSWSNGTLGSTAGALSAGTYTVTTSDGNSCTKTAAIIINNTGGPTINSINPTNPLCSGGIGSAIAAASGGTGTLSYTWSNGSNNPTAGPLTAGIYTVTVNDANNCPNISTVTITDPAIIIASAKQNTAAICGNNNGMATAAASGGTGVFSYSWSSNASGITTTNLSAGTYTVTITDANGCSKTATAAISNIPGPTITSINPTNPACSKGTGSATVNANGGTGLLSYTWSNGNNSFIAGGLSAGIYTVTVQDNNGCSSTGTTSITVPSVIDVNAVQQTAAACGNSNGIATATANGGTGTLSYSWNNTQIGPTANNLSAGIYTLTVTDNNACTQTATVNINNSGGPTVASITSTNELCNGGNTGTAAVTISGGNAPYTYSWNITATSATTSLTSQISNLTSATYTVTIKDANDCQVITTTTVTEPPAISTPTFITTSAACGQSNGSTVATAAGGSGSLTFSWSSGATTQTATNLSAANYTVTITDANNCSKTAIVSIGNTSAGIVTTSVQANITCNGGANGIATANINGGTPNFTYSWSNNTSGQITTNLPAASYTVTVTDANSCTSTSVITITEPLAIKINSTSIDATCANSNGSAAAIATGGNPGYTYNWSNGQTGPTANNLSAGIYTVTLTDSKGCTSTDTTTVNTKNVGILNVIPAQQTISEGNSVLLTVSGGMSYTWSPMTGLSCTNCSNPIASPSTSTTYTITATDVNGCTVTAMITITVKPACVGDEADVYIANVFSPNNDGKNDVLYIEGNGLTNIYWAIYDRWGNLLFEAFDQTHGWDGTKKGNPMESGTYVYYLKATCVKTNTEVKLKGNVSLIK